MALPKLNDTPKYEMKIPSTKQKVKFRPYLVKEEKILLMAAETKDLNQIMNAVIDTVNACIETPIARNGLTTFDLEYMFIKIRSKSVGENVDVSLICSACSNEHPVTISLEDIECKMNKSNNVVVLDENVSLEMSYPSYGSMDLTGDADELGFKIIANCIDTVLTQEERINVSEETPESIKNFIESMTKAQFEKVAAYIETMPQVSHNVEFDCSSCGEHNNTIIKGMQSFF